jgi:hypothetical protein
LEDDRLLLRPRRCDGERDLERLEIHFHKRNCKF